MALLMCVTLLIVAISGCSNESSGNIPGKAKKPSQLVEVGTAAREVFEYTSDREGTLRTLSEVKIFNQEEGRVTEVRVREGDSVRMGQVLIRMDEQLIRAEHDKAAASLRQAELDLERLGTLSAKKLVAEDAVTRAQTALEVARAQERVLRARLNYMTITAPLKGTVAMRRIEPGDVAPKHTHLLTVVDLSELVTNFSVSELVLPNIKLGDRAEVRIDALGDQIFPGTVSRIYPTIDPVTRRGQIEVLLKPVPSGARPGQFCRVTLHSSGREQLVIPHTALRRDGQGEHVFVYTATDEESGTVTRTAVRSGLRFIEKIEIREGLESGQQIITKGFIGLADGITVVPVNLPGEKKAGETSSGSEGKPAEQGKSGKKRGKRGKGKEDKASPGAGA
jgi:membrane fusion protein (multidrug efflux system)